MIPNEAFLVFMKYLYCHPGSLGNFALAHIKHEVLYKDHWLRTVADQLDIKIKQQKY